MFEFIKKTIKTLWTNLKLFVKFNKYKTLKYFSIFFLFFYTFYTLNLLPSFFYEDVTLSNRYKNFSKFYFKLNFFYWLLFLKNFETILFLDFFDNIIFFFVRNKNNLLSLDLNLLNFNKINYKYSFEKTIYYYVYVLNNIDLFFSKTELYNYCFYSNQTKYFRINIINGNTPVFLYFGFLFVFTNVVSLFFLSFLGFYGVFILNLITIFMFWLSTIMYFEIFFIDNTSFKIVLFKWFFINYNKYVNFEFLIDPISYSFMFLTLTIALFVYLYSFSYFRYEPNVERLIIFINLFVISMICLVLSGNLFVLFLGWELIGLTSFFLINFWSTRISTLKAAFKAFVFNKISDVSLLIVIFFMYFLLNETNISIINNQISFYNNFYLNILNVNLPIIELISFFFVLCAFIKSAQFGFHLWLPDSMEAPVPASALIHSATLVSAGVFLLLRFSNVFEYSYYAYYIIPVIGSFTAFFGGICSVYQSDVKKILAYSTISHCGFLMVCFSTYITEYTILYLYIHGFFKAAVFLCVGNIIRFSKNYQDFRRMGGFWKYLPFECLSSFVCLINLSGLPFTIGFYIKHLLLIGFYFNDLFKYFIITNIFCAAITGLIYSYRLFYYVFFDFKKSKKSTYFLVNRGVLFSHLYSNSSLITNIIIFLFILTSYTISLNLFNIFLNKNSLGDGLSIYSINQTQFFDFFNSSNNLAINIFYFNYLIIIFIVIILFSTWRKVNNSFLILNLFYFFLFFFIFFYFFYNYVLHS